MIYGLKGRKGNKGNKGETDIRFLLAGIVALFVLVLVGIGAYSLYTGKAIPFAQYLPDFMMKNGKIEGIEELRYRIIEDKVQYYDGTNWLDFEGKNVELEEKTIVEDNVRNDFKRYYFDIPVRTGSDNLFIFLINRNPELDKDKKGLLIKNGYVTIVIKETREQVVLDNENEVYIVRNSGGETNIEHIVLDNGEEIDVVISEEDGINLERVDSSTGLYKTIKERAIEWRDSVLKKPIEIGFFVGSTKESIRTCVKKIGTDLVVDLMKESDKCG